MTTKRAISRLDTSPTTSDIATCRSCGGAVTARKAYRLAGHWQSRPVCPRCKSFTRPVGRGVPPPRPRVVIVRREQPTEAVTGLRAKLAAKNLPTWADREG